MKKLFNIFMLLVLIIPNFLVSLPTVVYSEEEEGFFGESIIQKFDVSSKNIQHTGVFDISLEFIGQSEDSSKPYYIYPGKEVFIPIETTTYTSIELANALPQLENAKLEYTSGGIKMTFLEGVKESYGIGGSFNIFLRGLNTQEDSTNTVKIGGETIFISNSRGGDRGVFAGKTGMFYGESNPDYVRWFLRGNINGDTFPGGPLKIQDKLGEGQILDGSGIEIGLFWGGQQHQTDYIIYNSVEEFLSSEFGSSAGSKIDYDKDNGSIDILIPESVLSEKEFSFTYDALITDYDIKEFKNKAEFNYFENQVPNNITNDASVMNTMSNGNMYGKKRANLNINKVVKGTEIPIPGVTFEISREDKGPLFSGKDNTTARYTTNEKGEIRESGFIPGELVVVEVDAPERVKFNSDDKVRLSLKANNKEETWTIENEIETVSIPVEKRWVGKAGETAEIHLKADGQTIASQTVTAKTNWEHIFKELPKYDATTGEAIDYTITETPVDGYNTTISGTASDGFVVTNTITGKVSVGVTKEWVGPKAKSVTIQLLANDKEVSEATLTAETNWQHTFDKLDQYDKDGKEITYRVTETSIKGYDSEISGNVAEGFVVRNTNAETVSIPVEKRWIGKAGETAEIHLKADGQTIASQTLTAKTNWEHIFKELPKYDATTGEAIDYTIIETPVDGYNTTISGTASDGFVVTNTITGKVSVGVTKEWVGPKAKSVTIQLLANDKEVSKATLTAETNWQHTFDKLDQYDKDGKEITYRITETSIKGYDSEISGNVAEGFVVRNTNTETVSIPVEKRWVGKAGESAEIHLKADGQTIASQTLTAKTNWEHTFKELPKYDATTGEVIDYTITETPVDGYNTTISGTASDGFVVTNTITGKISVGVTKEWVGPKAKSVTIQLLANDKEVSEATLTADTNWQHTFDKLDQYDKDGKEITYRITETSIKGYDSEISGNVAEGFVVRNTNTETVSIPVEKRWIGKAGETAEIHLKADSQTIASQTVTAKTNWEHIFKELPKYDATIGEAIDYTITETPVDGYNTTISGTASDGFVVTNTITGKVSVGVTKEWVGPKAKSVTIQLLANDKEVSEATLTAETNWQHTFDKLDQYDKDGKEITYRVTETSIKGYDGEISGNVAEGFVVRNTNTETVSIPVEKRWVGKAGESAEIHLKADGQTIASQTLTAKTNWEHTFKELPKYDATTGEVIDYTITETPVDGYNTTISGTASDGFVVTNTITGKVSVGVTKEWVGPKAKSVTIQLLANDKEVSEATLTAETNWQHTFDKLDQYDKDGKEVTYRITETSIKGYDSEISGNVAEGFVVRNTNTETVSIPVEKRWVGKAGESAELHLKADGQTIASQTVTAKTNWEHIFKELPKYDATTGEAIDYTITETPVDGYNTTISGTASDGFVVTNTITGKVSLGVTKEWVGPKAKSVTIQLLANDKEVSEATLTAETSWQHTFDKLDQYDKDGKEITYRVTETSIKGYDSEISGNVAEGFVVRNTNAETVSIPVEKRWIGKAGETAEIHLKADGQTIASQTLTAKTNWEHIFKELPKYDATTGEAIDYTIIETPVDGYNTTISGTASDGFVVTNTITGKVSVGVTKEWVGPKAKSVTIQLLANDKEVSKATLTAETNWQHTFDKLDQYDKDGKEITYRITETSIKGYDSEISGNVAEGFVVRNTNTETVSIPVEKRWVGKAGETAEIHLKADGQTIASQTVTAKTNWEHIFKELPKYDATTGEVIDYTITETPVNGYNTTISGTASDGFVVTNTITGKVSVGVTKEWVGPKAKHVTIQLLANDKEASKATLTAETNWQHTFDKLDQYDKDGKEITYRITETSIKGYDSEISGNVAEGFVVRNTNTETVSIPVEKRWVGKAGESAELHLKADGQTIASQTVTAKTNWEHIFKELPKYDATTGKVIDYTITETPVDGYNTTISGTASDGFVVTNTITGKVSVGVTKEWVGPKAKSVTIQLLANDKEVSEATLTAETNWQHTFDKLDQYDKDGKEISYRVTETQLEGYTTEIVGDILTGFRVINTKISKTTEESSTNSLNHPTSKKTTKKQNDISKLPQTGEKETSILMLLGVILLLGLALPLYNKLNH